MPSPGAYSVSGSLPTDGAVSWSPTITKPQRPALLRPSDATSDAGRYSVSESAIDYVTPSDSPPSGEPPSASFDEDDDPNTRARRYTPKQRPAHRRGRKHESSRSTGAGRALDERERDRADLARTLPDLAPARSTVPGRSNPLKQAGGVTPSPNDLRASRAADDTASTAPTVPRLSPVPSTIVVDPSAITGRDPSEHATLRQTAVGHPTWPMLPSESQAPANAYRPASPLPDSMRTQPGSASQYQPLPNDRAGFEAFMQQRTAELRARSGGLHWNEQETLLIPREALMYPPKRPFRTGVPTVVIGIAGLAVVVGFAALLGMKRGAGDAVRAVPLDTSTSAAMHPKMQSTLIATEPSGAELVLGDAVLGNTPLEVSRPEHADETYLVRLRGFEPQLVRLTPYSGTTIRVMLHPTSSGSKRP